MMKQILFILTAFFFAPGLSVAQSADSIISNIRIKYQDIRNNLKSYDTVSTDLEEGSTEGGEATGYYNGKDIKLIEITYYGEMGKTKLEYYFDNGRLFFVFENRYKYNRPIYDTIAFDPKKTRVTKDRYYFHNEKLVRWLDNNNRKIDLTISTNAIFGEGLTDHAYKLRDSLKK
jgi:hypothetical protein